jgi:hypothetical protein
LNTPAGNRVNTGDWPDAEARQPNEMQMQLIARRQKIFSL